MRRVQFVLSGSPFLCLVLLAIDLASCGNGNTKGHGTGSGNGGLSFVSAVNYSSGGYGTLSVAVADVNGDGKPDIVVSNYCGGNNNCPNYLVGTVGVLLGNGDGTFQRAVTYGSGGYNASSVAIADVNGDGKPDIVVTNNCGSSSNCSGLGTVAVLLGNGDGTFQTALTYGSGGYFPISVAVADVNGDGKPDLLLLNGFCSSSTSCCSIQFTSDSAVGVLLNNGNGTFQTAVAYDSGGITARSIAVGDVNGDGKPDVVVAQCSGTNTSYCDSTLSEVGVMLGNGDGRFQPAVNYGAGQGTAPNTVALADINGDGHLDILVTNHATGDKAQYDGYLGVLMGNGNGTFQTVATYDAGGVAVGLAIADTTKNGKLDAVVIDDVNSVTGQGSNLVAVFPGNGDGTFQKPVLYPVPSDAASVVAADLNGDGLPDLVVGYGFNSGSVGVLINTSVAGSPVTPPSASASVPVGTR